MSTSNQAQKSNAYRSRGAPRNPNGVIATLERVTRQKPLPRDIRDTANKYLRSKDLFPKKGGALDTNEAKLARPGAHDLLLNALMLDQIFRGDTGLVVQLLKNETRPGDLSKHCAEARKEIERRAQIYNYWSQRMQRVEEVLATTDLRTHSIEPLLRLEDEQPSSVPPEPLALRAVRKLESLEQRSSLSGPAASDFVEQAEAYLSLGDFATAEARARRAIELEPSNPRAWFTRVVAAVKDRNNHLASARRHRLEATEMAEPMSAHERWAHESADDAASKAADSQRALGEIVPQALLNWPKTTYGSYEHSDWRGMLLELMLDQAFLKVQMGGYLGESRQAFELNGFEKEWSLKLDTTELPRVTGDPRPKCPLSQPELDALTMLFDEHDRYSYSVLPIGGRDFYGQELRLVHLRWVLGNKGYEQHWKREFTDYRHMSPDSFYRSVLSNSTLMPLWFSHCARHEGVEAAREVVKAWSIKAALASGALSTGCALEINVLAFHHQFARTDYAGCLATCSMAMDLLSGAHGSSTFYSQPFESSITVPAARQLYWEYLSALAAVMMRSSDQPITLRAQQLLDNAGVWQKAFLAVDQCFWTYSEEYEGGGGDDFPVPPYDIDLRISENWTQPVRDRDRPFESFVVNS